MAIGALAIRQYSVWAFQSQAIATTMALTVFAYAHVPIAISLRFPDASIFRRETLTNRNLWLSFAWAILGMIMITEIGLFRSIFATARLTADQWLLCLGVAFAILLLSELAKPLLKLVPRHEQTPAKTKEKG